jgi:mannan endo-1,4-beta-mannosidase
MRAAQRAMAGFLPFVGWSRFRRRNLNEELSVVPAAARDGLACFGCGDAAQAVLWLLRTGPLCPDGRLGVPAVPAPVTLRVPHLSPGPWRAVLWDTEAGRVRGTLSGVAEAGGLVLTVPAFGRDIAVAIRHERAA